MKLQINAKEEDKEEEKGENNDSKLTELEEEKEK